MKQNPTDPSSPAQDGAETISLSVQLLAYRQALESVLNSLSSQGEDLEDSFRQVLLARDAMAQTLDSLARQNQLIDAENLKQLAELDQQLKANARTIITAVGRSKLNDWREAVGAAPAAWWWFLQDRVPAERSIVRISLNYVLWILIAITLSFILEIVRRFLNGGTDLPSTVLQGLLALLATGTVVQGAKQLIEKASPKGERDSYLTQRSLIAVVIILVAVAWFMEWARPKVAVIYNDKGAELYDKKQLTLAIEKYQRAVSLEPGYAQVHFNMGNAYEDVLDYNKAMAEYQAAIMADQDFYRPYNNLARLYIVHRNEPLKALALIDKALTLAIDPQDNATTVNYRLYKNRGWANLALKNYRQAHADLEQALGFVPNGADAHCLLAQVLEAQQNQSAAVEWVLCKRLADQQQGQVEPNWAGLALERMKEEGKKE